MLAAQKGNSKEGEPVSGDWVIYRLEEDPSKPIKTVISEASNDPYSKFIRNYSLGIKNQLEGLQESEPTEETKDMIKRLQVAMDVITGQADHYIRFRTEGKGKKLEVMGFSLVPKPSQQTSP